MDALGERAQAAGVEGIVVAEHYRVWSDWEREAFFDRGVFAGHETRAHAIRHRAQSEIEARGLYLLIEDRLGRANLTRHVNRVLQLLRGQNTVG